MKPKSPDDVLDLMDAYIPSAALNTAMELGIFWLLDKQPHEASSIAKILGIPGNRCRYWLQLLMDMELIEPVSGGFAPTSVARATILDIYSQETWTCLASMARERFPVVLDLTKLIREPISTWQSQGLSPPNYLSQLQEKPEEANRFTRMLYELHLPLAEALADCMNIPDAKSLLDIGGGSGVFPMALLRRYPVLEAVVIDIPNVCEVGSKIAQENKLGDRISYTAIDFIKDELPGGFDVVLCCDTGPYSQALFRKIRGALNPGGRLIIVEQFPAERDTLTPPWLTWSFRSSLHEPDFSLPSLADIEDPLERSGFRISSMNTIPHKGAVRWSKSWFILEADITEDDRA